MNLRWLSPSGVEMHSLEELQSLRQREDGFLWLDIPECDDLAVRNLLDFFLDFIRLQFKPAGSHPIYRKCTPMQIISLSLCKFRNLDQTGRFIC